MEDWQQRVVDEKTELDEKIGKLSVFVRSDAYHSLENGMDKDLLDDQLNAMEVYSNILAERIERF